MSDSPITDADLAQAHRTEQRFDELRVTALGIKAERDELLAALRALYDAARTIDTPPSPLIVAMMVARLAIIRAEEMR